MENSNKGWGQGDISFQGKPRFSNKKKEGGTNDADAGTFRRAAPAGEPEPAKSGLNTSA